MEKRVRHLPLAPFVNDSERRAFNRIKADLVGNSVAGMWVLLTNYSIGPGEKHSGQPLEIDCLAVGSRGIFVIEVKHWAKDYLESSANGPKVTQEAIRANDKAKRVAGRLHAAGFEHIYVPARFLLTRDEKARYVGPSGRRKIQGIEVFGLSELKALLDLDQPPRLKGRELELAIEILLPHVPTALTSSLTRFGEFRNLHLLHSDSQGYRSVYTALRGRSRDAVWLHLYDLTVLDTDEPRSIAEREYAVFQRLQKKDYIPPVMDSFQEATEYPGEMYLFSHVDPGATPLTERAKDPGWTVAERTAVAKKCLEVLRDLHTTEPDRILHRNLTPETILVRSNNQVLFTRFQMARVEGASTVAGALAPEFQGREQYVPPEARSKGLASWTPEADIYALCASLRSLFESPREDRLAEEATEVLDQALSQTPEDRPGLDALISDLAAILEKKPINEISRVSPEYWDDQTRLTLNRRTYRVVARLGSGGFGSTFKVIEIDPTDDSEHSGPYVAKVITHKELGPKAAEAYALVRAQTGVPSLAGVLEVRKDWEPDCITALLKWIPGTPLSEWVGILPLYFEERGIQDTESAMIEWAESLLEGLNVLHHVGLVHGDVSPRNIIVNGLSITLTDYDLAARVGSAAIGGTTDYCAPEVEGRAGLECSDDVYALAATLFCALFERRPFDYEGERDKHRGLRWAKGDRERFPRLAAFLGRATSPDRAKRYANAMEALLYIRGNQNASAGLSVETGVVTSPCTPNEVPWLQELLQTYPGSLHGNRETRGLDSEFAWQTYVETDLERNLVLAIQERRVRLVILCGNAGDGKTSFLQHLARKMGFPGITSAQRLLEYSLPGGPSVRMNLDGAASFQGRSAQDILTDFLIPFRDGFEGHDMALLLAINDGPLLTWLETQEGTWLSEQLSAALDRYEDPDILDSRLLFVDLNTRSLVGGLERGSRSLDTGFVDALISRMVGPEGTWKPCETCTAQVRCPAWRSVRALTDDRSERVRKRMVRALQAVHQRGEVHITARELRAAIAYVFFGIHTCSDLHADPNLAPLHYWDRAFDPDSGHRQGLLLSELQALDPALEVHPVIDRYLRREPAGDAQSDYPVASQKKLASRRRQAYFEWTEADLHRIEATAEDMNLCQGRHLDRFLLVATGSDADRLELCSDLCMGLARLEDLPEAAFTPGWLPLRITPRTPTETVFWIRKHQDRFSLKAHLPRAAKGVETLHTHVVLSYTYPDGRTEGLLIDARLFHLLMELKDGYQLADVLSDDVFANLSIFTQRLMQEEETTMFAWNPSDSRAFRIWTDRSGTTQTLRADPEQQGAQG